MNVKMDKTWDNNFLSGNKSSKKNGIVERKYRVMEKGKKNSIGTNSGLQDMEKVVL